MQLHTAEGTSEAMRKPLPIAGMIWNADAFQSKRLPVWGTQG